MENYVYITLKRMGINVTEEESIQLQNQWDFVQGYKKDFDHVSQNTEDIVLSLIAKRGERNE